MLRTKKIFSSIFPDFLGKFSLVVFIKRYSQPVLNRACFLSLKTVIGNSLGEHREHHFRVL